MSTTAPLSTTKLPTGRVRLLAAAGAAVAAGSVALTLAVATGGGTDAAPVSTGEPATAQPDRAKLYHRSLGPQQPSQFGSESARRAAERFHHFR
jgi:hypothetical protein